MMDIYHQSIGRGANLLVNLTPDMSGSLPKAEVDMLETFGKNLEDVFSNPIAEVGDPQLDEGHVIRLDFEQVIVVNRTVSVEGIEAGQRIRSYQIQADDDGKWKTVAEGSSIGRRKIDVFEAVETKSVRLKIADSVPLPLIQSFMVYGAK
jgi:alpha-L-fucosidase